MNTAGIGTPLVTSGIWRPVYLEMWNEARISNLFVEQRDISAASAHLDVQTEVIASHGASAHLTLTYGLGSATRRWSRT